MDTDAVAAAAIGAQTAQVQMAAAAKLLRMSAEQDANAAKIIDQAEKSVQTLANVAAGVGQIVDFEV
ncbi:MAG: hypothetical protein R3D62_15195 [Xanthobacteraceae bacterium]